MGNEDRRADVNEERKQTSDTPESKATQKLLDDVMISVMLAATKAPTTEATNIGQVKQIEIPGGWEAGPDYNKRQHAATYQEYHPAGAPECQLGFYYRGRRTSDAAGKTFHDLLDKPPHALTDAEFRSLEEIVRDKAKAEDFRLESAKTEDLNGKRVLRVKGRYVGNQNDAEHVFIDADGTGSAVQEVFFQAPKDKFSKHIKHAEDAIRSIRWK